MAKHKFYEDIVKFPNLLCIYRVAAIFICAAVFIAGFPVIAALFGLTAGLTDYWDGIYARKHNMVTKLGELLDGVSDMLFNFIVMCVALYAGVWSIWIVFAWGIRDIGVLTMRTSAAQLGFSIPSSYLGKLASNFIFYALFLMPIDWALNSESYRHADFVAEHFHPWIGIGVHWLALAGIIVGIAMQWISAVGYARRYIEQYDVVLGEKAKETEKAE
ncbi:MAG: CDP-alcohol phosphatidyltransferase family protein [Proteobacteria bacterium]|nr:CDP-alcohol phosphatidyltransferase family protein [Pseudomonadota bacterium]